MMNIMRADLYRIFRGKSIYVTGVLFLLIMVLQLFASGTVGINISTGAEEMASKPAATGARAPFVMMAEAGTFLYFLLPLVMIIAAADFSSGGAKNVLASGMSRTKYYVSKLMLAAIFCAALLLADIIVAMVIATIANGFGGTLDAEYIASVLKPFGLQLLLTIAATCVGIFLTFATRSAGAVIGLYIAWLFVPLMIVFMLVDVSERFIELAYYDITFNMQTIANFSGATSEDIARILSIGVIYILASTTSGIALFKRGEIK